MNATADAFMGVFGLKRVKPKRCKACKQMFQPSRPMQVVCSPLCSQNLVQQNKEKLNRKAKREGLEKLKTRRDVMKEAQTAVNAWIRARDAAEPCISCGRFHQGQWHAGHYLSTGARPGLRFDPRNIHKQCQPCNTHLSGNLINYRIRLIAKIGLEAVESLEADVSLPKWSIDDLKAIKACAKRDLKRLQKEREHA